MAVAFDAQAFKDWTGTGGTFTLPVVGTPRGVWVGIVNNLLNTDQITTVSYGGATLTRVATNGFGTITVGEPGSAYQYFKGSGLAASGTINIVSVAGTFSAFAISMTANQANTEIAASAMVNGATVANPAATISATSGDSGIAVGVLFSGQDIPTSCTVNPGFTGLTGSSSGGRDFGSQSALAEYGVKTGPTVPVGWTDTTGDQTVICAALIREVPPTVLAPFVHAEIVR